VRVMGLKEEAVQSVGFKRLAIFRPGIIGGNAHTPGYVAWLGRFIPGRFGTIGQHSQQRDETKFRNCSLDSATSLGSGASLISRPHVRFGDTDKWMFSGSGPARSRMPG
jgi:hypothetical protein